MEHMSLDLENGKTLIKEEKEKYNRAITNDKELKETKAIYLKIKSLEEKAEQLTGNIILITAGI
jgi:hypothetical protein